MAVRELWVSGYRSIRKLRLPLEQLNVIAGPNGSGKTNLYRSMYLLSAAAAGNLARTLADEGGMPSVLWAGERTKGPVRMTIGVRFDDLAYELSCGLVPPVPGEGEHFRLDPEVKEEHVWVVEKGRKLKVAERKLLSAFLRDSEGQRVSFPLGLWGAESMLAQLSEPHRFPLLSELRVLFSSWRFYHHFRTDPDAPARHPQIGIRTPVLSHDGSDLAAALQTILYIGDEKALREGIRHAFPGSSLRIDVEKGRLNLLFSMPGINRPLDARELSDGTLRYLCLLAALLSPRPPALLALNEPETSLHPDLLEPLAALILQAGKASQVWVTTHSDALARAVGQHPGAAVVHLVKASGATQIAGAPPLSAEGDEDSDPAD